jgi:tetrahydromethanopterin S-methyltransferase subunit A
VDGQQLVVAHATTTGGPTGQRFLGRSAAEVYRAILAAGLVSRLDHAAYLGAELARAEVAARLGLPYRQDRPLPLPHK